MKALKKLLAAALVAALPLAALAQEPAKPADETVKVTPYGFVLLNTFIDMGTFATKDYPGAATRLDAGDAFLMSARQSRFGVRLSGKDATLTGADLSGVIEFDFKAGHLAGANAASTNWYNGLMRLRLAAATATWKSGTNSFSLLAGQDYGLVNPLFAESLAWVADPLFWQAGNYWRRSPQIRATYAGKFGDIGLTLQAAAMSPADSFADGDGPHGTDFGAGNASGVPDLEARAALSAMFGDVGGTVGVSFHNEERKYLAADGTEADSLNTSVFGVDADLKLTKFLQVKGEFYSGSGTDDTYFGIGPSVTGDAGARDTVDVDGFWVQGIVKPVPVLNLTLGYGVANADDAIVTAAAAREKNEQIAGGVIVNAGKAWRFGVEFIQTTTTYGDGEEFDASQLAISSQLRF